MNISIADFYTSNPADHTSTEATGPSALILSSNSKLALQTKREASIFSFQRICTVCLYGGGDGLIQMSALRCSAEVIMATQARLNELLASEIVQIKHMTYLVPDGDDYMLDMGF